jgi:hypothetical protein
MNEGNLIPILFYFQLERACMNNEELGLLCWYDYTDDQNLWEIKYTVHRVNDIMQIFMLGGFIFLDLAKKTRRIESRICSSVRHLPEIHSFGPDRCT